MKNILISLIALMSSQMAFAETGFQTLSNFVKAGPKSGWISNGIGTGEVCRTSIQSTANGSVLLELELVQDSEKLLFLVSKNSPVFVNGGLLSGNLGDGSGFILGHVGEKYVQLTIRRSKGKGETTCGSLSTIVSK